MKSKNKLRIIFMGTPGFAVATLKSLIEHNYDIVGVITAPDKPAGRGRKLKSSDVKIYSESQNLKILQPTNLKNEDFIKDLKSLKANLQIVVAFRMLPEVVWKMPEFGTFNLHASILPNYRGAAPIHWAIINGETQTGVTTFFIDEKIDTGALIAQHKVSIEDDETVGSLHDKLMSLGSELVIDTVKQIENNTVTTTIQPKTEGLKTAYKLNKDNCKIDWTTSIDEIYNKIRGLNPFPVAWSQLQNDDEIIDIKLFKVEKQIEKHNQNIGILISNKTSAKVVVKNGYIILKEVQLSGKRKMDIKSLLNGYKFASNAKML